MKHYELEKWQVSHVVVVARTVHLERGAWLEGGHSPVVMYDHDTDGLELHILLRL